MKLYHGTNCTNIEKFKIIKRILKDETKGAPDLGPGVYFTSSIEQAKEKSCLYSNEGAIYEIDINLDLLNGIIKSEPDEDYYMLCYLSRINLSDVAIDTIKNYEECDYIFGKMIANTKKFDDISNKFNEQDDDEMFKDKEWEPLFNEFKKNVSFHENMNQYCFKNNKAIEIINRGVQKIYYTKKVNMKINIISEQSLEYDTKLNKIKYINK